MVLWGPPGTGKTTLARLMARAVNGGFVPSSAVTSGIKEIKAVMEEANQEWRLEERPTVLFFDEIHRFNKAQQDTFLPYIQRGCIVLVGATTEKPSFEINSALLSRLRVLVLKPLSDDVIRTVIRRALESQRGLAAHQLSIDSQALGQLVAFANGDARIALSAIELASRLLLADQRPGVGRITRELHVEVLQKKALLCDKSGEEHLNLISALHKSLRNSGVQASLYWLVRMIKGEIDILQARWQILNKESPDAALERARVTLLKGHDLNPMDSEVCGVLAELSRWRAHSTSLRRQNLSREIEQGLSWAEKELQTDHTNARAKTISHLCGSCRRAPGLGRREGEAAARGEAFPVQAHVEETHDHSGDPGSVDMRETSRGE